MPLHRYPIETAAQLAFSSYKATSHPSVAPRIARSLDQDDVQAHLLDNGVLLIPGSNSVMDYLKFNLRVLWIGGRKYAVEDPTCEKGASGTLWHQGFLRHAKVIYDWVEAGSTRPTYIIGHSLGAASAQILSKSWGVAAIGFAAPRPRKARGPIRDDEHCLLVNRDDDPVTCLPLDFHHMGTVHKAHATRSALPVGHHMQHYKAVVREELGAGLLKASWPL